jgi:hypothetical protein
VTAGERRYLELIDTLADGVVVVDGAGSIALVNVQAEAMFGYDRDELIGRPLELLVPGRHRAEHKEQREYFARLSRSRAMGVGLDLQGLHKDGHEFPVEISLSVAHADGDVLVTSVISDISERKSLEQQLLQSQKLEAIGRLASGIAHDFNNVLQVISGYAASLKQRASDPVDGYELDAIADAAGRAAALTRALLAFARREAMQSAVLDLNVIVHETQRLLTRMVGEEIEIALDLDPTIAHIFADRGQIEQVLSNLIVNARDAMPGGGRVVISTRRVDVGVEALAQGLAPGGYIRLCVTDAGAGMDDDTIARAFDPFFTTKEEGRGTGLGLATVHGIAVRAGGAVQIMSRLGHGTSISVDLPIGTGRANEPLPIEREPPVREPPMRGGGERLLLVEDDLIVRRLVESFLTVLGYDVTSAENGVEALELASAGSAFDLVVTDFVMAGMNGSELVERLAELGMPLPTLYVSGYAPGVDFEVVPGKRSAFLQKPFTSDQLARSIRRLLDAPGEIE